MPRIRMSEKLNNSTKMANINTEEYVEMFLDADGIYPSRENNYPVENIEELADNMLLVGHLEPLLIGRVDGKDNIISGHRRFRAIQYNINRGYGKFKKVRCLVKEMSKPMFMLTLISGNAFNRILDDVTLVQQAKDYREWLSCAIKNGDVIIEGAFRDYVAKALGVSSTKMAQVDKINSSLCKEGMQSFQAGETNFSKAYETSRLPEDEQKEVIQSSSLLSKDVKELATAYKMENKKKQKQSMLKNMDEELARVILEETEYGKWLDANYKNTEEEARQVELIKILKGKGRQNIHSNEDVYFIFFSKHYDAVNKSENIMSRRNYSDLLPIVIAKWKAIKQKENFVDNAAKASVKKVEQANLSVAESKVGQEYNFPNLKNNDERKEWINNYKKWGVWHRNPILGITYYRFIFRDGIQLIAEEMQPYKQYWSKEEYTSVVYHILGKQPKDSIKLNQYGGRERKFNVYEEFRHIGNSETEIIELLKYEKKQP